MENSKIVQDLRARKLITEKGRLQPGHRKVDPRSRYFLGRLVAVSAFAGPAEECPLIQVAHPGIGLGPDTRDIFMR